MEAKNKVFKIFDEWILERGYKWNSKLSKKELWKMFAQECSECGIINVFKCSDYNELKRLLGLEYRDKEGIYHKGFYTMKDFKFED